MNNMYTNIKPISQKPSWISDAGSGKGYVVLSCTSSPSSNQLMSESLNATDMKSIVHRADWHFLRSLQSTLVSIGVLANWHSENEAGMRDVGNISIIGMDVDVSAIL